MSEPEHILRQQGKVIRPQWCSCDDGYWMRNLVDPQCHYHSDYGEELRDLLTRAAEALEEACLDRGVIGAPLIAELRKAAEWNSTVPVAAPTSQF